jgi:hypothetical protein
MNKFTLAAIAATATLSSVPAKAVDFTFAFTSSGGDVGSGRVSTTKSGRYYIVNAISGTVDGNAITGLSNYGSADQKLKVVVQPHSTSHFTLYGVSFADSQGTQYNLTGYPTFTDDFLINSVTNPLGNAEPGPYSMNFTLTAVPEPAIWGMMIAGFGAVGFTRRQRRKAVFRGL